MDLDSFPTLTSSSGGWPMLTVQWSSFLSISVEVCPDEDGQPCVVVFARRDTGDTKMTMQTLVDLALPPRRLAGRQITDDDLAILDGRLHNDSKER